MKVKGEFIMICPNCGKEISDNTDFCPKCYIEIDKTLISNSQKENNEKADINYSELKKKSIEILKGKWKKAIFITLFVLLLIIAISLISYVIQLKLTNSANSQIENIYNSYTQYNKYSFSTPSEVNNIQKKYGILIIVVQILFVLLCALFRFGLISSFHKLKNNNDNLNIFDGIVSAFSQLKKYLGIFVVSSVKILGATLISFVCVLVINLIFNIYDNYLALVFCLIFMFVFTFIISLNYFLTYFIVAEEPNLNINDVVEKSKSIIYGYRFNLAILLLTFTGWAILSILTFGIGLLLLIPYINITLFNFYETIKIHPVKKKKEKLC